MRLQLNKGAVHLKPIECVNNAGVDDQLAARIQDDSKAIQRARRRAGILGSVGAIFTPVAGASENPEVREPIDSATEVDTAG